MFHLRDRPRPMRTKSISTVLSIYSLQGCAASTAGPKKVKSRMIWQEKRVTKPMPRPGGSTIQSLISRQSSLQK